MTRRISLVVVVLAVLFVGSRGAWAQELLTAEVPFTFVAAGRTLAPGKYEVQLSDDQLQLSLLPEKGPGVPILTLTRLAGPEALADTARLVFDKVENRYYLSEAWFPGLDGFELRATKEPHTHHTIKLSRRSKAK